MKNWKEISGTWKDKRNVNMITSFDSFKSATYINENGKLTTKPHVIFNYNQNMREVDLLIAIICTLLIYSKTNIC